MPSYSRHWRWRVLAGVFFVVLLVAAAIGWAPTESIVRGEAVPLTMNVNHRPPLAKTDLNSARPPSAVSVLRGSSPSAASAVTEKQVSGDSNEAAKPNYRDRSLAQLQTAFLSCHPPGCEEIEEAYRQAVERVGQRVVYQPPADPQRERQFHDDLINLLSHETDMVQREKIKTAAVARVEGSEP